MAVSGTTRSWMRRLQNSTCFSYDVFHLRLSATKSRLWYDGGGGREKRAGDKCPDRIRKLRVPCEMR
jgi:hypothetical protein